MVRPEELDQLRCEITAIPRRHYNHAARALVLAERLLAEREAYRIVVLSWKNALDPIRLLDDSYIGAEAKRILEGKTDGKQDPA